MGTTTTRHRAKRRPTVASAAAHSSIGLTPPGRQTNEDLFRAWKEHGDERAREALLQRFLPLARKLARRYASGSDTLDDVTQVANMGLLKAIDRFDADRGKAFAAFAIPTVLGEVRRYLRDHSWSVHVARGAQERSMEVRKAIDELEGGSGHPPTVQELAQYLEIEQSEVLEALEVVQARRATSLDAPPDDDPAGASRLERLGGPDANYERVERWLSAGPAIESLSERERSILAMGFIGEMTQVEIGAQLGVSQMQVSRLMRRALERAQQVAATG
jgi:RNA polymerase sigma-B factor